MRAMFAQTFQTGESERTISKPSDKTMPYNYNKNLTDNARELRKNMTPEEKHLWYDFLKKLPVTVNRQKNIGNYIVDFFVANSRLVIEIDGKQHGKPENVAADKERDGDMKKLGITVLRYSNKDINERFNNVCYDILKHIGLNVEQLEL